MAYGVTNQLWEIYIPWVHCQKYIFRASTTVFEMRILLVHRQNFVPVDKLLEIRILGYTFGIIFSLDTVS